MPARLGIIGWWVPARLAQGYGNESKMRVKPNDSQFSLKLDAQLTVRLEPQLTLSPEHKNSLKNDAQLSVNALESQLTVRHDRQLMVIGNDAQLRVRYDSQMRLKPLKIAKTQLRLKTATKKHGFR